MQSVRRKWEKEAKLLVKLKEMTQYETDLFQQGYKYIAGVDEVGRGPLAGQLLLPQSSCQLIFLLLE